MGRSAVHRTVAIANGATNTKRNLQGAVTLQAANSASAAMSSVARRFR